MASSVIHMCVAKKINEKLKYNENMLLLGSIAPDTSKHVGETKTRSHFFDDHENIMIDKFLNKYGDKLNDPFIMGYFIHLYTDLLWDKYFICDIVEKGSIKLLNGEKVDNSPELYKDLIYNDYTNLNIQLLDEYNLDLSLFYEDTIIPKVEFDEIPLDRLHLLIKHTDLIIQNTKVGKAYTFELDNIIPFIELCTKLIYSEIERLLF